MPEGYTPTLCCHYQSTTVSPLPLHLPPPPPPPPSQKHLTTVMSDAPNDTLVRSYPSPNGLVVTVQQPVWRIHLDGVNEVEVCGLKGGPRPGTVLSPCVAPHGCCRPMSRSSIAAYPEGTPRQPTSTSEVS